MKRFLSVVLMASLSLGMLAGCGSSQPSSQPSGQPSGGGQSSQGASQPSAPSFDTGKDIAVVSREEGSGTRGAFIELFGIQVKGDDGSNKDMTTKEAIIQTQTGAMLTQVANDSYAIGYVSLGSLNDTVKALEIDGAAATTGNVKNGSYTVKRPFILATKGEVEGLAKDFIDYILSAEGQAVIAGSYIAINDSAPAYAGDKPAGTLVVAGSSSVTPVMEKLKEAYCAMNTNASIEIQESDSSAGMTATMEGACQIGMSSRELKDNEKAELIDCVIALDGIAVIVSKDNTAVSGLSKAQVKDIFTGEATKWNAVAK